MTLLTDVGVFFLILLLVAWQFSLLGSTLFESCNYVLSYKIL